MNIVVVGGGIVGCHISYLFSKRGDEVFLLEKERSLGEHTSTRNSGVIHAGIYYPKDSLKAILCVRGRHLTYEFLERYRIPYKKCGKIIVALVENEFRALEELKRRGDENGVENLKIIKAVEIKEIEPRVRALLAIYSPETGILDMGVYMRTIERIIKEAGVNIVKQCKVISINEHNKIMTTRGEIEADLIINASGLHSDSIAKMCGLDGYEIRPIKGDYYNTTEMIIHGLVYPVPDSPHSLGIHLTKTLGDEILIGPSAISCLDKEDYNIKTPREEFEKGALAMVPDLNPERIYPAYSGNRPKVYYKGELQMDFVIKKQENGRIHLLGIESPGLTAAPAIAEFILKMIK